MSASEWKCEYVRRSCGVVFQITHGIYHLGERNVLEEPTDHQNEIAITFVTSEG
jgi:hypothetical protein